MEENTNVVEILKDKLENTKLYSPLFGDVYFYYVGDDLIKVTHHGGRIAIFFDNGRYYNYPESEPLLFPSKEMRDWSKFAWKRGDVLISNDGNKKVFFNGFTDDTYALFKAKHGLEVLSNGNTIYLGDEDGIATSDYTLEDKDVAQTYINTIEERLGGKLNMGTLEIEPAQTEFKDGDIVCISGMGYLAYGIVKSIDNSSKKLEYYVLKDTSTLKIDDWLSFEDKRIQLITETQQVILFKALANEGKAWNADKKQIVDLKSLWTPKPFDRVLVRDDVDEEWNIDFFKSIDTSKIYKYRCMNSIWIYCIPYEGNEHLLSTNKDMEG